MCSTCISICDMRPSHPMHHHHHYHHHHQQQQQQQHHHDQQQQQAAAAAAAEPACCAPMWLCLIHHWGKQACARGRRWVYCFHDIVHPVASPLYLNYFWLQNQTIRNSGGKFSKRTIVKVRCLLVAPTPLCRPAPPATATTPLPAPSTTSSCAAHLLFLLLSCARGRCSSLEFRLGHCAEEPSKP